MKDTTIITKIKENGSHIVFKFLKFTLTSGTSCLLDLGLFQICIFLLKYNIPAGIKIVSATIIARIISSLYNYFVNKKLVFADQQQKTNSIIRYYIQCLCQMTASALLVWLFASFLSIPKVIIKFVIDVFLFLLSFQIQRIWVFK